MTRLHRVLAAGLIAGMSLLLGGCYVNDAYFVYDEPYCPPPTYVVGYHHAHHHGWGHRGHHGYHGGHHGGHGGHHGHHRGGHGGRYHH